MTREYDRQNAEITRVTEQRRSMIAADDRRIQSELNRSARERARWEHQLSTLPDVLQALRHIGNSPGGYLSACSITGLTEDVISSLYSIASRLREQQIKHVLEGGAA